MGYYRFLYRPKKDSLSEFLDAYSKALKGKLTVIQIGANDGITHDPIHKFIKRDRWNGVLLEPQRYVFETYLSKIYQNNPHIHPLCAAIGPQDGSQKLYKIGFSNMRWATGLASFNRSNVEKAYSCGLVAVRCKRHALSIPTDDSQKIVSENVTVISPQTLFQRYNLPRLDLLQIDTEGYDYEVIKMFHTTEHKPKAIVFENIHLSSHDLKECEELLHRNNYVCKQYGSNTLAMRRPLGEFEAYFSEKT